MFSGLCSFKKIDKHNSHKERDREEGGGGILMYVCVNFLNNNLFFSL